MKQPYKTPSSAENYRFLGKGGEMGQLIREKDWLQTPLGDPASWPQSLKTILSIIMNSKFPKFLFWGPELICFYNDAFRPSLGIDGKHPAIGKSGKEVWPEIWEFIGPLIEQVMSTGEAVWFENQLVPFYRNGRMEDIYWTFSYSPINDEDGKSSGVFVTCIETTEIVSTRRKIEESERNLRLIILQAHIAIAIFRGPEYVVEIANTKALELWGRVEADVLNKPILKVMSELESQGIKQLLDSVYQTGVPFSATELPVLISKNNQLETAYINFVYEALFDVDGIVNGIITMGIDVTQSVTARKKIEESESRFRIMVQEAPVAMAVISVPELLLASVNGKMLKLLGKPEDIIGKPYKAALPEASGQPFLKILEHVFVSGEMYAANEAKFESERDGKPVIGYYNYIYQPVNDETGATTSVMAVALDVTEQVVSRQKVQELNEELASVNEEISSSNEEINAANEELNQSQKSLQALNESLTESESLFRSLVTQAPVGICIIRAKDLVVVEANDSYLELVGKRRADLENRSIWDAVPEAADAYRPIMNGVIDTAIAFIAKEHELQLIRNGVPEQVFVDFVYEPMLHINGTVNAIMVLAIEVSDKVIARRGIEEMEERVRLAVEAAEIGTFDLDLEHRIMHTSARFDNIFGFDSHVSWDNFAAVIHPDDRAARIAAHERSYVTGKLFYEARVVYPDGSIHWVRVQGQVYYDREKKPARVLGTLLDITQFKRLQQQKDDFISIASHELKTPVTSLKASLQLLERMQSNPSPEIFAKLIGQASKSMQKISALIEDLLNVSRASESQLRLNKTTFTIAEMLNACCNHVRVAGKYTLTVLGDEKLQVYADEHAIDQVMVNLVNNAVKYASESPEIFLSIAKDEDMAKIAVSDTGPGIAPEKLPHLFDRYYQAEASGYQRSGLGLGLYISAEIIKRHGGQIGVESELGRGSTFWFTLPIN